MAFKSRMPSLPFSAPGRARSRFHHWADLSPASLCSRRAAGSGAGHAICSSLSSSVKCVSFWSSPLPSRDSGWGLLTGAKGSSMERFLAAILANDGTGSFQNMTTHRAKPNGALLCPFATETHPELSSGFWAVRELSAPPVTVTQLRCQALF